MKEGRSRQETAARLMCYSAAAGLGAFAFGPDAEAAIVYTDIPDLQINRGDPSLNIDFDGDGYDDVVLLNTNGGGFGGVGTIQWRGTVYWGAPGSNPAYPNRGAGYSLTNTSVGGSYYVRSFNPGDVIGPSNPNAEDLQLPPGYGLVSNYGGYGGNAFWDASEYAGIRIVDANGQNARYGWARFQITVHDVVDANGLPGPDGIVDNQDYWNDPNRYVTAFEYAYETTPDTDILAGDVGSPSLPGDLDGDGYVGLGDLDIVLLDWNHGIPSPPNDPISDPRADVTGDGYVGLSDLDIVLNNWNTGTPPATLVPEPGALGLLAAGAGALAFKRGRRM